MGKDWLSHLALMHIHYDIPIDFERVVDTFATNHVDLSLNHCPEIYIHIWHILHLYY